MFRLNRTTIIHYKKCLPFFLHTLLSSFLFFHHVLHSSHFEFFTSKEKIEIITNHLFSKNFNLSFQSTAVHLGDLTIKPNLELDRVRNQINQMVSVILAEESIDEPDSPLVKNSYESTMSNRNGSRSSSRMIDKLTLSSDWCFIDCKNVISFCFLSFP